MEKTNQHIIHLLKQKNPEGISLLYDKYAAALNGIILRIVQSEGIAADVLQDTFVKIWKNGPNYDSKKGSLFTWMLNIARNTAIDKTISSSFKKNKKIQEVDHTVYNNISFSSEQKVDQIGLKKVVNQLEEKYRVIIDLIYFKGFTQSEVVEHLDIPLGTVKSRVRIALRELNKVFNDPKVIIYLLLFYEFFQTWMKDYPWT